MFEFNFTYLDVSIQEDDFNGFLVKKKGILFSVVNQKLSSKKKMWIFFCRVCLLVQDAYRMFSEGHSEGAILKDQQLEGKSCSLMGMKVLQKATRGRWGPSVIAAMTGSLISDLFLSFKDNKPGS